MKTLCLALSLLCFSAMAESLPELYELSEGATQAYAGLLPSGQNVVNQMYFTVIVESGGGKHDKQVNGPARSLFQLEKATVNDIYFRYLSSRPKLKSALLSYAGISEAQVGKTPWTFVQSNPKFAAGIARLVYAMDRGKVPDEEESRAEYWKKAYQKGGAKGLSAEKAQKLFIEYTSSR